MEHLTLPDQVAEHSRAFVDEHFAQRRFRFDMAATVLCVVHLDVVVELLDAHGEGVHFGGERLDAASGELAVEPERNGGPEEASHAARQPIVA